MLDGFVHPNQVGPYLLSEGIFEHITYSVVGNEGCLGLAWKFGPLAFEAYTSDVEPRIAVGPLRTIFWQRIGHIDTLPGWHTFFNRHSDMGVAEIKNPEAY